MSDTIENQIQQWRAYVAKRAAVSSDDVDELESHLRDRVESLQSSGLDDDEAFLVAVRRLGSLDEISREFAREHSDRLWKQLVIGQSEDSPTAGLGRGWLAIIIGAVAAIAVRVCIGLLAEHHPAMMMRTAMIIVMLGIATYLFVQRRPGLRVGLGVMGAFAVLTGFSVLYPFADDSSTSIITTLHIPIVGWLLVGVVYVSGALRSHRRRMDFIRFSGEWAVYMVLIALGGAVLIGISAGVFSLLDLDPEVPLFEWVLPMGAAGATVVATMLVEEKQSVIENIAPVLTRIFTPLVTVLLVVLIGAGVIQFQAVLGNRDLLMLIDMILLVTVALVLYSISARPLTQPPGWFDRLQLIMVIAALLLDAIVLVATALRMSDLGLTPNRVTAVAINMVLLINLVGTSIRLAQFVRGRTSVGALERWQTSYLPVYLGWALIAVVVLPLAFRFA